MSSATPLKTVNRSRLQGEANSDFDDYAAPIINQILRLADVGKDSYQWAVTLRDCHRYSGRIRRPNHMMIRIGSNTPSTGQIEIKVSPADSEFCYEATLSTPWRHNWAETIRQITGAANKVMVIAQNNPVKPSEPSAPAPQSQPPKELVTTDSVLVDNIEQLQKLRSNLDAALSVALDAKTAGEMRSEIMARVEAARLAAEPFLKERKAAEAARQAAEVDRDAAVQALAKAQEEVKRAQDAVTAAASNIDVANIRFQAAQERLLGAAIAAEEPEQAYELVKAELARVDEIDAQRAKVLQEQSLLAGMLAALANQFTPKT